jgi:PAS domain S-box-containing protein
MFHILFYNILDFCYHLKEIENCLIRRGGREFQNFKFRRAMNEISCSITSTIINYVKNTKPEFVKPLLDGLPYNEVYLLDTDKWISWDIERILEDRLVALFEDESIMFKIGRSVVALKSLGIVNILFNLFMTPERLIRYTPKIARYFTKDIVHINVLETTKESATVELKIKGKQTRGACLFNQGMFSLASELFALGATSVLETQCIVSPHELGKLSDKTDGVLFGAESCIYQLRWKNKIGGFVSRFVRRRRTMRDALQHLEESHRKLQKAYDCIQKSEERYRELLENASDIICFLDLDGIITFLNKKGLELSGYTLGEVIGQNFIVFIDKQFKEEFLLKLRENLKSATAVFELGVNRKNGEHLILSINSSPIKEEDNIIGIMLIARDITQEREMTGRLLEAERFAAKGMVAAEIAHEINNSLANIETALFIIKNIRIDSEYRKDVLKDVHEEIERMSGIVRGILEVYRSDDTVIQSVDVNSEILKVINITKRRLKGKGISIVSKLAPDLPSIPCCPGHIKQILLNLIKNAEEAMHPNNKRLIIISTEEDGGFVKLGVSDTGFGIPEEMIKKVFSPLFTSKADGTGLGLSICREIAQKYGGDIKIESKETGTSATVSLPIGEHG